MDDRPARVRYREGQRLTADDLTAEQEYLRGLDQRHSLGQHAPGVVTGLHYGPDEASVAPGLAIDDGGRPVVLEQSAPTEPACAAAWLIHCEAPASAHTRHSLDRVRELARIVRTPIDAKGEPVAPDFDAVHIGRFGCKDFDPKGHYTSVVGAIIRDPAGRAAMQVGPASALDRDAFVVSTTSAAGAQISRIALDHEGNSRFSGAVSITDYRYCRSLQIPGGKTLTLRARDPGIAGAKIHFLAELQPNEQLLHIQFVGATDVPSQRLTLSNDVQANTQQIEAFPSSVIAAIREDASEAPQDREDDRGAPFRMRRQGSLHPCGASLQIQPWPSIEDRDKERRGCEDESSSDLVPRHDRTGIVFEPMAARPEAPPVPAIYSIATGDAARPAEELRLDLGELRKNDASVRLAIGRRDDASQPFRNWMQVNGMGRVILSDPVTTQQVPISIAVAGNVERGAIKADLSDPNFTALLRVAWLAGLKQSARPRDFIIPSFSTPPAAFVETGQPLQYVVRVANGDLVPITLDSVEETLSLTATGQVVSFLPVATGTVTILPGLSGARSVDHAAPTTNGSMSMLVQITGKIGGASWIAELRAPNPLLVLESPTIDFGGVPESVAPNTPFQYRIQFANNDADHDLDLTAMTVTDSSTTVTLAPPPVLVRGGEQTNFARQDHVGITAPVTLTVTANYTWKVLPPNPSTLPGMRTIKVDLTAAIQIIDKPTLNSTVQFKLDLTNTGTRRVRLQRVQQRLTSSSFASTSRTTITLSQTTLDPGETASASVTGARLPANATKVVLEIFVEYRRSGTSFSPPPFQQEIDIP